LHISTKQVLIKGSNKQNDGIPENLVRESSLNTFQSFESIIVAPIIGGASFVTLSSSYLSGAEALLHGQQGLRVWKAEARTSGSLFACYVSKSIGSMAGIFTNIIYQ